MESPILREKKKKESSIFIFYFICRLRPNEVILNFFPRISYFRIFTLLSTFSRRDGLYILASEPTQRSFPLMSRPSGPKSLPLWAIQ